ncbi:MAG TPA: SPW repeat protein [Chthoniobacterales bacterium]
MKIVPRNVHGILDYLVGLLLAASPWLFHFADGGPATFIPVVLGLGALLYSLLTDYELGVARIIPFTTHLILDFVSGVLLLVSPWLFGFHDHVYLPHVVFGLLEIGAAVMTRNDAVANINRVVRR